MTYRSAAWRAYRSLVYDTPGFIEYWRAATPIDEISRLRIGSRPTTRRGTALQLDQIRAIPWVFSWMQSRFNLPGWYGLGTALSEHPAALNREMYEQWPFFRALLDNAEMSLLKADLGIATLYSQLLPDQTVAQQIFDRIRAEYDRAVEAVLHATNHAHLMDSDPIIQRSIAVRTFAHRPGFTAVVLLTLGLAIGSNVAIFSVASAVLLKPLPYRNPERLVLVWNRMSNANRPNVPVSGPDFVDYKEQTTMFEGFAGAVAVEATITGEERPEQVMMGWSTVEFFKVLGVRPFLGRDFEAGDGTPIDPKTFLDPNAKMPPGTILLTYGMWQRQFASDPKIVGKTLQIDGNANVIVGVLPEDFQIYLPAYAGMPTNIDAWGAFPVDFSTTPRDGEFLTVVGRLKPEVTLEQAQAEMDSLAARFREQFEHHKSVGMEIVVNSMHRDVVDHVRPLLLTLLAASGFVLLIACANVANLLLVRAAERERGDRRPRGSRRRTGTHRHADADGESGARGRRGSGRTRGRVGRDPHAADDATGQPAAALDGRNRRIRPPVHRGGLSARGLCLRRDARLEGGESESGELAEGLRKRGRGRTRQQGSYRPGGDGGRSVAGAPDRRRPHAAKLHQAPAGGSRLRSRRRSDHVGPYPHVQVSRP